MFHSTPSISTSLLIALTAWLVLRLATAVYNVSFHPLRKIPGPSAARLSGWYKTYIELYLGRFWCTQLYDLHREHGPVVRVGPSELHFSHPQAYFDIHNNLNRWDKEESLYRAFGEDRTSFGFLTYAEAKQRKDILQPLFSKRAIVDMQSLISSKIVQLADILAKNEKLGQSTNIYFALRCFAVDAIITYCFAKSVNALDAEDFNAPIVVAMEASNPAFHTFKHLSWFRWCIFNMPDWMSMRLSPETSGLTRLQAMIRQRVDEAYADRSKLVKNSHQTIYHRLLDPNLQGREVPEKGSLYEEGQTMIFAGTETVGNTLYVCFYQLARSRVLQTRLRDELRKMWQSLDESLPRYEQIEKLPLLTAVIKESLRLSSGVVSPLSRIVPHGGATIDGIFVPAGTNVGMSSVFIHHNPTIFAEPKSFAPDRWLASDSKELEKYLIPFSRGPRSCPGTTLAWCEMYYAVAVLVRRFEITLDEDVKLDLDEHGNFRWRDCFLPWYQGEKMRCWFREIEE